MAAIVVAPVVIDREKKRNKPTILIPFVNRTWRVTVVRERETERVRDTDYMLE